MKKIKSTAIFLSAALSLCAGLGSCAGGTEDRRVAIGRSEEKFRYVCYGTPFYENIGEVPYGAHPDQNTEENWQIIADCGFNYAMPINDITHEQIISTLEQAQKVGIKVLIMDYLPNGLPQLIGRSENRSYDETMALIEESEEILIERYTQYASYESFAGIQIKDEPSAGFYNAISAGQDWWYEHFSEYEYYCNLLPSYASYLQLFGSEADGGYSYPDYVERFVETTNPAYLSYDHYPFQRSGVGATIRPAYLYDLETFAEASKKYDIPFYCYQQCTKHLTYTGPETYREYAWQVYTALTYGCRGLQTFKYWAYMVPEVNSNNLGNGLVDPDGNRMPLYYAVQQVNREIGSFEELYMNFSWEGTMPIGSSGGSAYSLLRYPLESLYGVEQVSAEGDAIIGQFSDNRGNTAYMVTNYISPYKNESNLVTMKFNEAEKVLICKKGRRIVQKLNNHTLVMQIGPGEGYFVIPVL